MPVGHCVKKLDSKYFENLNYSEQDSQGYLTVCFSNLRSVIYCCLLLFQRWNVRSRLKKRAATFFLTVMRQLLTNRGG